VASLRQLHFAVLFLGVHGMIERDGFSTPNLLEADVNRAFVDAAHQLVVLADHTRWGQVGLSSIAPLEAADIVITDTGLDIMAQQRMAELVGNLRIVEARETAS
jgi:DeoR/GlpR family transcriptional regulator of sugar metabolism